MQLTRCWHVQTPLFLVSYAPMLPRILTQAVLLTDLTASQLDPTHIWYQIATVNLHIYPNCLIIGSACSHNWQNQCSNGNSAAMRGQTMTPIIGCLCKAYDGLNWYFIHHQQDGNDQIAHRIRSILQKNRAHSQSNIMNENFMRPYSPSANYEAKSKPCRTLPLLLIHSLHSHT